jgi:hypothetical protein
VILFYYYAGCANIALKHFAKARDLLEQAMTVPQNTIHEATVMAYKRLILVGLLTEGKLV